MSYPPAPGRRRKLCRTRVVVVVGLVMIVAATGFSYWQETRFPARTVQLRDVPVRLRVQDGVERRELSAITDGIRSVDRFMRRKLRRTVRRTVEARVARKNGCRPFESSSADSIGEADDGFLCVATRNLHWKWLIQKDLSAAMAVSAHEYVHVLQAEIGCLADDGDAKFRWLIEGMAEAVAWRALVDERQVSNARVERRIRTDALPDHGLVGHDLYPLAAYERASGADREYALWHLAVRRLLRSAVQRRAAPRERPDVSLRRFCYLVGRGTGWRHAFDRAFGQPVGRFYADFEEFRRMTRG